MSSAEGRRERRSSKGFQTLTGLLAGRRSASELLRVNSALCAPIRQLVKSGYAGSAKAESQLGLAQLASLDSVIYSRAATSLLQHHTYTNGLNHQDIPPRRRQSAVLRVDPVEGHLPALDAQRAGQQAHAGFYQASCKPRSPGPTSALADARAGCCGATSSVGRVRGQSADPYDLQLLPALDDIELAFRKDWEKGDKEAALVFTGERVKNKFFR